MNKRIAKWIAQIFLSSTLVLFTCKFLPYIFGGGSMGQIVLKLLIVIPIVSTLGIVLGDLSLYKGYKPSILAVIIAFILGGVGLYLALSLIDLFGGFYPISNIKDFIRLISCIGAVIMPSLIGYNAITQQRRKFWLKSKEKQEQ